MVFRVRGPFRSYPGGTSRHISGTTGSQLGYAGGRGQIESFNSVGPPYLTENPFTIWEVLERRRPTVSGSSPLWTWSNWYFPVGTYEAGPTFGGGLTFNSNWVTAALARINPSVPNIQIGTFLWELREFPKMLYQLGHALTKPRGSDVPGSYVAYQFGWAPLVSDLKTLINLASEIEKKESSFNKAQGTKRMRGTLENRKWVDAVNASLTLDNKSHTIKTSREWTSKTWYVAKWKNSADVPSFATDGMLERFGRALGSHQPMSAIWNALPWSWLIDYFANVGTYLEATEGTTGKRASICIMWSQDVKSLPTEWVVNPHGLQLSQGSFSAKMRIRRHYANPTATIRLEPLPWLSDLGTLGALLTAGAMRRRGD